MGFLGGGSQVGGVCWGGGGGQPWSQALIQLFVACSTEKLDESQAVGVGEEGRLVNLAGGLFVGVFA